MEPAVGPILLALSSEQIAALTRANKLLTTLLRSPLRDGELAARLRCLTTRFDGDAKPPVVECNGIVLNLSTYQVSVSGRPLDMTYMEYQLLKHFMINPGEVLTREVLLKDVWGLPNTTAVHEPSTSTFAACAQNSVKNNRT